MLVRRSSRRGFVVVVVALALIFFVGFAAVALDGGVLYDLQKSAQSAADAAALAAATDLYNGKSNSTATTDAQTVAADLGFLSSQVTVNIPPLSGTYTNQSGYAEVIVSPSQNRYFSAVLGTGPITVQGRAVAVGALAPFANGIIVLDPNHSNALTTTNSANIVVTNGSIIVDSNDSNGGTATNTGYVQAPTMSFSGNPGYNPSSNSR
jgi:uncharacterized membrane protein